MSNDPNYTPVDVPVDQQTLQRMIAQGVADHMAALNNDPRIDVAGYAGTAGGQEVPLPRQDDAPFNPNIDGTLGTAPSNTPDAPRSRGLTTADVITTHGATSGAAPSVPGSSEGPNQPGKSDVQARSEAETGGNPASDAAPKSNKNK